METLTDAKVPFLSPSGRRRFLKTLALTAVGGWAWSPGTAAAKIAPGSRIMTVRGEIAARRMGFALPHEHLMSTFGAASSELPRYDEVRLTAQVLPYLKRVKSLGCRIIFDCTAAYFGRDPRLLKAFSERSGLHLVTNTGYYGAADDRYVPVFVASESPSEIAARWLDEWRNGIGGTDIRPGFVKLAVDGGDLSDTDAKLIRAGALAHRASGLTLAVHTGNNPQAAYQQLAILDEEDVDPTAWIWVHAHAVEKSEDLLPAAQRGAWLSFDGLQLPDQGNDPVKKHLTLLTEMKRRGFFHQVLLSHDGNSFTSEGRLRPYDALFTALLPDLRSNGFTDREIRTLTVDNPARAFSIRVREKAQ
ncbi:MAG: phosphotriesterase [Ferruginibacter sp.]|nr:phosphotriesterase [Cytophagales bacterium]